MDPYLTTLIKINSKWIALGSGGGGGLVAKSCSAHAIPWTVTWQAPLSMGFSREDY